jgi:hypothetical protein
MLQYPWMNYLLLLKKGIYLELWSRQCNLLLDHFRSPDIRWLLHVTTRYGLYNHTEIAVIPWDWLQDFVQGKQNNHGFPNKFTKTKDFEHKICNHPKTLTHPKENSGIIVTPNHVSTQHQSKLGTITIWNVPYGSQNMVSQWEAHYGRFKPRVFFIQFCDIENLVNFSKN